MTPPATGFKEWEIVCDALASGQQSILLRKGGIAEGREGFQFKHPDFFLFPTLFHEQADRIRPDFLGDWQAPAQGADKQRESITIELFAHIDFHMIITDWSQLVRIEPFHIWTEDELRARYTWSKDPEDAPGISLACIRVYRLAEPWTFPNDRRFGGCRSWIDLPDTPSPASDRQPVLDEDAFSALKNDLRAAL
ncbi:MAG: DUF1802 family protein [Verrucomicrobiota bacterium]